MGASSFLLETQINLISSNFVTTQQSKSELSSAFAAPKFGFSLTKSYLCSQL